MVDKRKTEEAPPGEIEDMLEKAWSSGQRYTIEEAKQELRFSFTPVKEVCDFGDIDGEKIYCLMGPHGIGKTSCIHQLAREIEAEVFAFNLGGTVQEDLHGLPKITKTEDGIEVAGRAAAALAPPFYRKPKSKSGLGIWLLDEVFSGVSVDHQLFVRMVAGGKCDELRMFPGWFIAGTTNPPCADYLAVQKIDSSTADRFVFFCLKSSAEEKLQYWRTRMHPLVYKFLLLNHVEKLSYVDALSSRTWWNMSKELAKRKALGAPVSSMTGLLSTHAGNDVAMAFAAYLVHGEDPVYYPVSCSDLVGASDDDHKAAMTIIKKWVEDDNVPLIGATKWDITSWIHEETRRTDFKPTDKIVKRLADFMVEIGSKGHADMVDDIFQVCRQTDLMQKLLNATQNTKLKDEIIAIHRKHMEKAS